jgi:hypothetical protein
MDGIPADIPGYNPADGYEIAGFGWHQGWNDRVTPAFAAVYEENMALFIEDVRAAVGVPDLPFVIATTGMDGNPDYSTVELAQLAMENFTAYPQFDGNVAVTDTQGLWFDPANSPSTTQGYHWNRNAKTYYLIGQSMASEMQTLIESAGGNDFTDWIGGYSVGGQTGIDDDPDGDGVDSGVENFFGTAPDTFTQGLVSGSVDSGANTFTFTHPLNANPADDLTAVYRWSTDLKDFHDDGDPNGAGTTTVGFVQGPPSGGMVTVTATISGTVIPDKLFVNVEVRQN